STFLLLMYIYYSRMFLHFFLIVSPPTYLFSLSLHDALPISLLGSVRPASRAAAQSLVVATAAKFELSTVVNVVDTISASAKPASLAVLIAPVASLRTSVLNPSPTPSTSEARTHLVVMYPTSAAVSSFISRSHWATSVLAYTEPKSLTTVFQLSCRRRRTSSRTANPGLSGSNTGAPRPSVCWTMMTGMSAAAAASMASVIFASES